MKRRLGRWIAVVLVLGVAGGLIWYFTRPEPLSVVVKSVERGTVERTVNQDLPTPLPTLLPGQVRMPDVIGQEEEVARASLLQSIVDHSRALILCNQLTGE